MKKCPPGVICVENLTLGIIVVILVIIVYLGYVSMSKDSKQHNNRPQNIIIENTKQERFPWFQRPNYPYTNLPGDVLLDPYAPPLRDERFLVPEVIMPPPGRVPINISTNIGAVDTNYRQVGILTPLNGNNSKILPLMGRPLFVNRDKWQYYTMSDQNNSIKLPINYNGRSCTNEYGCDQLYNGYTVYVEGYKEAFKITMYENDTIRYLPFL
jgi:Family of unknown function (DUF5755)